MLQIVNTAKAADELYEIVQIFIHKLEKVLYTLEPFQAEGSIYSFIIKVVVIHEYFVQFTLSFLALQ